MRNDIKFAIEREKQLNGGSRKKKIELINGFNKDWEDLYPKLLLIAALSLAMKLWIAVQRSQ